MYSHVAHVAPLLLIGAAAAFGAPRPVLWQPPEPSRIHSLEYGPGGPEGQPSPPLRFFDEEKSGTKPKVWIVDSRGRKWIAKFGKEVHPDVFATRFVWAMGYNASPVYFVAKGRIDGMDLVSRAATYVSRDGSFTNARFKLVDESMEYVKEGWHWDKNPFTTSKQGRQELSGLKILMMLLSNWDGKDAGHWRGSNTAIFRTAGADYYVMDDWGASMGEWGHVLDRARWSCEDFTDQSLKFVKGVDKDGFVDWGFHGTAEADLRKDITQSDVQWISQYLAQFTDADLLRGLLASGANENEASCYVRALRTRIDSLIKVATPSRRYADRE